MGTQSVHNLLLHPLTATHTRTMNLKFALVAMWCVSQAMADLPVLFQFSQPTHNVAVFRGADLEKARAAGLIKSPVTAAAKPAPVVVPAPAPVAYKPAPAPVVVKPAPVVYKPAPAPVVYKPAPAPVAYKPAPAATYHEPEYAYGDAVYTWEYAVKDDYTSNDFGHKESRDGAHADGKYYVALPDGRLQT